MAAKKDDKDTVEQIGEAASEQAVEAGRQARHMGEAVAEAGMTQATELSRRQGEQVQALMGVGSRLYGDLGEASRGDVDVLVQTSARLAKGMQDVTWEVMNYTQQSLQLGMKTANEMMTCRTIEDMLNVHRNFVRQSVDSLLQEGVRLMELSNGIGYEATAPLQRRAQPTRH